MISLNTFLWFDYKWAGIITFIHLHLNVLKFANILPQSGASLLTLFEFTQPVTFKTTINEWWAQRGCLNVTKSVFTVDCTLFLNSNHNCLQVRLVHRLLLKIRKHSYWPIPHLRNIIVNKLNLLRKMQNSFQ